MIEILRDKDGTIKAVIEYYIVNKDGSMNDKGDYIWLCECEVAPQYRNNGCMRTFIKIISNKVPWFKYGYFGRRKYGDRVRMYSRKQWLSLTKE